MKQKQPEQQPLQQLLDEHSDSYDAATLSRLRQARETALLAADKKPMWFTQPMPMAFASVCMLAVGVFLFNQTTLTHTTEPPLVVNDMLLDDNATTVFLSNDIDIEFYEEIEFYEWLDNADAG